MTREEREAMSIGKALAKVILRMEEYDGDPQDVLEEAELDCKRKGVLEVLAAIEDYYLDRYQPGWKRDSNQLY